MKIKLVLTAMLLGLGPSLGPNLDLGLAASASADTLLIEIISQQSADEAGRPGGGMSMNQVEEGFGQPTVKHAAVGEPPISRWEYADFIVYFEGQTVLHSVLKRRPQTDQERSPGL